MLGFQKSVLGRCIYFDKRYLYTRIFAKFYASSSNTSENFALTQNKTKPKSQYGLSRQQKLDHLNFNLYGELEALDLKFNIFNDKVFKVLDLGYVPGNWCEYARQSLMRIHNLNEEKFSDTCFILGFDLLFGVPLSGVSSIQGNIFSKQAHENIQERFKEARLKISRGREADLDIDNSLSYYFSETNESLLVSNLEQCGSGTRDRSDNEGINSGEYKPDLILSDLSAPLPQGSGFFNNTCTKPYIRISTNEILNRPIVKKDTKSSIDLADAALILTCDLLNANGTLVMKLSSVNETDPEISLLRSRLEKLFQVVHVNDSIRPDDLKDLHFVCINKKSGILKRDVFSYK